MVYINENINFVEFPRTDSYFYNSYSITFVNQITHKEITIADTYDVTNVSNIYTLLIWDFSGFDTGQYDYTIYGKDSNGTKILVGTGIAQYGEFEPISTSYGRDVDIISYNPNAGYTPTPDVRTIDITENGEYDVERYKKANVNVNTTPNLQYKYQYITDNGGYQFLPDEGYDGLEQVVIDVNVDSTPNLQNKSVTITENGKQEIYADEGYDGLEKVKITTKVPSSNVGVKAVELNVNNGTFYEIYPDYGYDGISRLDLGITVPLQEKTITSNGTYTPDSGYVGLNSVNVNIPITDKQVITYTKNGDYTIEPMTGDTALKMANVTVDVEPTLQEKTITSNGTYTADDGYDGLKSVTVNVESGGGGAIWDFTKIGYDGTEESLKSDYEYSLSIYNNWDPTIKDMRGKFCTDENLVYVPKIDTSNVMYMGINTRAGNGAFEGCDRLTTVPLLNTSSVLDMSYMFYNCPELTTVPKFDTSNVKNMVDMFGWCSALTSVPLFNTSKVVNMTGMFRGCSALISVPQFDTSNVTSMNSMFYWCNYYLASVPQFDTSKVTDMNNMFYRCSKLTTVPLFDTSKVTDITGMFDQCSSLTTIDGFTNLGQAFTSSLTLDIPSNSLTSESVTNIANTVYDMHQNTSVTTATIKFTSTVYNALTDEQKSAFAAKNWTIASE